MIDRQDRSKGGYVGFVIVPDRMGADEFAQLGDSFEGTNGPSLTITFTQP